MVAEKNIVEQVVKDKEADIEQIEALYQKYQIFRQATQDDVYLLSIIPRYLCAVLVNGSGKMEVQFL